MFCSGDPRRISSVFDFPRQRLNIGSCDGVRCVKLFCNSVFKKAFFFKAGLSRFSLPCCCLRNAFANCYPYQFFAGAVY